jgi:phosphoglycolate phosphatase
VLIGDTRHDFEVATAMGCRCLLVADGYHPRAKLDLLGAEVVVNELSEAQAWLEEQRP